MTAGVQLDLFDLLAQAEAEDVPRCLYKSPARGVGVRIAEFDAWQAKYGRFGSLTDSHAWTVSLTCPSAPTERCAATTLHASLRRTDDWSPEPEPECGCWQVNELLYRGACTGCDWEGPERPGENPAAEDALDHAHPGWRSVPLIRVPPPGGSTAKDTAALNRWKVAAVEAYPAGWLESGGPIRTARTAGAGRHVPSRTPWGGYDVGVPAGELP